ncbi:MAG: matrixin family metalloprotease [Bacteriovorax sp.]|nr:matrixin family metalloprotease [Bacteriovorax sp.]
MKNLKTQLTFISFFLLLLISCKQTTTTTTQAIIAPTSCIIGKWSDSYLPLSVKMSSEFSSDYSGADLVAGLNPLEQMAKVWNTASTRSLITVPFPIASTTGYTSTSSFRDSEIGIYKSHTWYNGVSSSALAITQFYGVITSNAGLGQYIDLTHADIIVNYRDYGSKFTMTNNPMIEFDLPTVVLHEMGHLLGLCHETTKPSIMAPYYLTVQRSLRAYDADLIHDIYIDNAISAFSVKNVNRNALSSPPGTEVSGVIELHADGKCIHYLNGKKLFEHSVDASTFKRKTKILN